MAVSKKKVYVGMSGGVDSSVSAALLKAQGYDVTGVFIKVWQPDWIQCTWKDDRLDAMRVAAQLNIPFITLDLEKEYKEEVVDYMIAEYKNGRTPNPDVMCNRHVKFGGFFAWAMAQGADYVATGHYAQVEKDPSTNTYKLLAGNDSQKDQTYFLWTLTQEQLSKTLFPVGNIEKPEVRKLAQKFKLATAEKKDSQGLCFIGKIDIKEFLSHFIQTEPGKVLDEKWNVIGSHNGALLYTIGERHGFTITSARPDSEPLYVIAKDTSNNTLTVGHKNPDGTLPQAKTVIKLSDIVWNQNEPLINKKLQARARYRAPLQTINFTDSQTVQFEVPQSTLSAGQSLVIYDGNTCIGGGIIETQ